MNSEDINDIRFTNTEEHDERKGIVVITWPLKDDAFISDDEIVEETSLDQYGRPFTTVPGTDPDGKPMREKGVFTSFLPSVHRPFNMISASF